MPALFGQVGATRETLQRLKEKANETLNATRYVARSKEFDLDNGAGVTLDDVMLRLSKAYTITAARIVYTDATTGTVAAANVKLGTTVGGVEIVDVTAYENAKAVGTITPLVVVLAAIPANTPLIARHTGVAAAQAGKAYVEIEYTIN